MVTNINLSSPEVANKKSLTGKTTLISSVALVVIAVAAYVTIIFLKGKYEKQKEEVAMAMEEKQKEIQGPGFSGALDFQERLNILDKIIDDHAYWDGLFVKISGYIIPEVSIDKFSGKKDEEGGGGLVEISGTAQSMDALARELILLKSFSGVDSLEFKQAGEITQETVQRSGVSFDASLKMNKSSFENN